MCRTFIPSISKTTSPLIPWPLDKSLPTLQILLALRLAPFLCCSPLSCTRKQSSCPWSFLHTFLFECSFIVYLNTACSTTCKKLRNPAQDVPGVDQLLPTRYNNNACLVNTCDQSVLTEHLTPLQILQTANSKEGCVNHRSLIVSLLQRRAENYHWKFSTCVK